MTPDELKRLFPHASQSTLKRNAGDSGLHPVQPERDPGNALVGPAPGEKTSGPRLKESYRVVFNVHARRPLDWDNYRLKDLQDCLVKSGLLPEDDYIALPIGTVITQKVDKKEEEGTVVTIERI